MIVECPNCNVKYEETKSNYEQFGVVVQDISKFECPICHQRVFRGIEVDRIQESIRKLGPTMLVKRKVTKAAGRPAIYLPANLLREVGIDVGHEVYMYVHDKKLLIDPNT